MLTLNKGLLEGNFHLSVFLKSNCSNRASYDSVCVCVCVCVCMCFGDFAFVVLFFKSKLTGYSLDMLHSHSYGKPHVLKD